MEGGRVSKHGRSVYRRPDGTWVNKRNDSDRASSLHRTQDEAKEEATRMLGNSGGGELTIMERDTGRIRDKITVPPGNDPFPPRDKK